MVSSSKSKLKRAIHPMPGLVRKELTDRKLLEAYHARPAYQQNDYIGWINQAKMEATRIKRLEQMLDELEGGRLYMNMRYQPKKQKA